MNSPSVANHVPEQVANYPSTEAHVNLFGAHKNLRLSEYRRFDAGRQGWLALLAHWWERRLDVINRGFSGYNTRWLMPLVEKLFVSGGTAPTKLVTIFLGANDCVLPGNPQHGQFYARSVFSAASGVS